MVIITAFLQEDVAEDIANAVVRSPPTVGDTVPG